MNREEQPSVAHDKQHAKACHERWRKHIHRSGEETFDPDTSECLQCGGCALYVPLIGALGSDWGVCTNADSPFDRRAMFEHDSCDHFVRNTYGWSQEPFDRERFERRAKHKAAQG